LFAKSSALATTQAGQNPAAGPNEAFAQGNSAWGQLLKPQGNPYMQGSVDALGRGINENLTRRTLPALQSAAVGQGVLGGSRPAIAAGVAAGDAGRDFAAGATELARGGYESDMQRMLAAVGLLPQMQTASNAGMGAEWNPLINQSGITGNAVLTNRSKSRSDSKNGSVNVL
jgi:hypothetical protein